MEYPSAFVDHLSQDPNGRKNGLRVYEPNGDSDAAIAYQYYPSTRGPDPTQINTATVAALPMQADGFGKYYVSFENFFPVALNSGRDAHFYYDGLGTDGTQADGYYARVLRGNADGSEIYKFSGYGSGVGAIAFSYETEAMLDGLELLCDLKQGAPRGANGCGNPPVITSVNDLSKAQDYLQCIADQMREIGSRIVLVNFPKAALDPLREASSVGSYPYIGGDIGVDVSQLRSALIDIGKIPGLISSEMERMGSQITGAQLAVQSSKVADQLANVQLESNIMDRMSSCAAAAAGAASVSGVFGGGIAAAAVTCANSVAQIQFRGNRVAHAAEIGRRSQSAISTSLVSSSRTRPTSSAPMRSISRRLSRRSTHSWRRSKTSATRRSWRSPTHFKWLRRPRRPGRRSISRCRRALQRRTVATRLRSRLRRTWRSWPSDRSKCASAFTSAI